MGLKVENKIARIDARKIMPEMLKNKNWILVSNSSI